MKFQRITLALLWRSGLAGGGSGLLGMPGHELSQIPLAPLWYEGRFGHYIVTVSRVW